MKAAGLPSGPGDFVASGLRLSEERRILRRAREGQEPDLVTLVPHPRLVEVGDELHKDLLDNILDPVVIHAGSKRVFVNRAYLNLLGLTEKAEAMGKGIDAFISPDDAEMVKTRALARQKGHFVPDTYEYKVIRPDGEVRVVETHAILVTYEGVPASMALLRDVTERIATADGLKRALSLQAATLESTGEGIFVVDLVGKIVDYNSRFSEMLGIPLSVLSTGAEADALSVVLEQLRSPNAFIDKVRQLYSQPESDSFDSLEFKDGRVLERHSMPQRLAGTTIGRVWSFRDVTERKKLEDRLAYQINHDPFTGLLNRYGFLQATEKSLAVCALDKLGAALLAIDLDQFKDVNDSLGHATGDELLAELVQLLQNQLGGNAVLGRLGGDEFAILLPGTNPTVALTTTRQLLDTLGHHVFETGGGEAVNMTASAGVVLFPDHGSSLSQLMSRLDLALYEAKDQGRNKAVLYSPRARRQSEAEARLRLRHKIRDALEENRFLLYGQPIMNLRNERISHFELLLRMKMENGRILRAGEMICVAERSGLILPIDRWVVGESISILAAQQAAGLDYVLEVNLSGKAFADSGLLRLISDRLSATSVDPSRLVFEVTESAAISDIANAQRFIRSLKELGCRFALDDFGVGFSSLQHLKQLPVDYLKIDGSFIRGLTSSTVDQELVKVVVGIARALGMQTIAEFVGSAQEAALLKEIGVDFAQGYYVGRPRDISKLPIGLCGQTRAA